jgi:hypothetical protein
MHSNNFFPTIISPILFDLIPQCHLLPINFQNTTLTTTTPGLVKCRLGFMQGVWCIVDASSIAPTLSSPPTEAQSTAHEAWAPKSDKAAGWMYLSVENDQKIYLKGIEGDPVKMWIALHDVHMQKHPGMHFNAYDNLFSIRKQENKKLQTLMNRVDTAICCIQNLCPADFDLAKLHEELASMAMIRALPDQFSNFDLNAHFVK